MTIVYFIIALSILIIVHELGHFLAARLSGIAVEVFSIGFGPKIFSRKKNGTEYRLSLLPFGGYVQMRGDEYSKLEKGDESAFYSKPILTRAKVVSAGPIMNLVLCFLLMPIVFMIGKMEPAFLSDVPMVTNIYQNSAAEKADIKTGDIFVEINGKKIGTWRDFLNNVVIATNQKLDFTIKRDGTLIKKNIFVAPIPDGKGGCIGVEPQFFIGNEARLDKISGRSPADKAGLKEGDVVVAVNDKPVKDWTDMVILVGQSGGSEITLTIDRKDTEITAKVLPEYNADLKRYIMGVSKDLSLRDMPMVKVKYGFVGSIKEGLKEVHELTGLTLTVLKKLVTLKLSYKALGGPIQIAQATAMAAKSGLGSFLYFLAFLSLQLGILNLLPIPVLDGGHLVFFGIEAVRRKPLNERAIGIAQHMGLALLLLLMAVVTFNDLLGIEFVRTTLGKFF